MDCYHNLGVRTQGLDLDEDLEANVHAGDVSHPGPWHKYVDGCDLVIHAAAIVTNNVPRSEAWRVNVLGTRRVLDVAIQTGVKRFVHLSSLAAMRFVHEDQADERAPILPTGNPYVDTKIASEHAVLACHAGGAMDCTIVRPGDVYGPGSRPWVILPLEMMQAGKFLLPAHGQGLFSPVYIDDLVEGTMLAATKAAGRGHIFNISGGIAPTCLEFFSHHARMSGSGRPRAMGTGAARLLAQTVGGLTRLFGGSSELGSGAVDMLSRKAGYSIDKAASLLGDQPAITLDEGMQRTEQWARAMQLVPASVAK